MKSKLFKRLMAIVLAAMLIIPTSGITASAAVTLSKDLTLYMIPNTHLDTAWQWPYQYTASNYARIMFTNQLNALESNTTYRFTTSASSHFQMMKDYYDSDNPTTTQRLWPRIKALVANGQLDITGGQVVEPDLNIPSGEALVRQSLYAQHFFEREFGKDKVPKTGLVPDVFGFSGQFPQILYKSEMPYFVTSKINWNATTGQGGSYDSFRLTNSGNRGRNSDIMYWRGLDGQSSVLSYLLYNDYNNTSTQNDIQNIFNQNWQDGDRNTYVKRAMAFYGGGDMGQGLAGSGGDSYGYVNTVANSTNGARINVKMATATEYFEEVTANEDLSHVRTYEGEMYLEYHRGTYTSWARTKKYNRSNEILGESAEKAATIGFYTKSIPTNSQDRLEQGWYKVLMNQMHDVLPGSALAYQYYTTFNQQELTKNMFNGIRDNALAALAYRADTNVGGKPVFVYNELSWLRNGEVTVDLSYSSLPVGDVIVYDGNTPIYPSNVVRDAAKGKLTVTFMAANVPAIGYKIFDVRTEEEAGERTSALKVDETNLTFENDYLKMKLNPTTGYISSLQNKVDGIWHEAFAQNVGTEGAELHVYKDCDEVRPPQNFDVWELNAAEINKEPDWILDGAPKSIEIIENSPEKVTVRVIKEWSGSQIAQDMTMYADSDRVDVHLLADWYQTKRLLKVSFPIAADNGYATYETAFGAVQRPTNRDNAFGAARYEVPGHKWIDVTDGSGNYGVSILNDAKYGFDSLRKVMGDTTFVRSRITVARTPRAQAWAPTSGTYASPAAPYVVDSTTHEFNYSIYPHAKSWEDSQTVNKAQELNYPMTAFEAVKGSGDGLTTSKSFASTDKSNVIISALKNQYDAPDDPNTLVVRVYESSGRDTDDVALTLPGNIISAKEVNLLEHDYDRKKALTVSGDTIKFNIGKYEILTIEAKLAPAALTALTIPQESVALAFNQRITSPDSNRRAAFLEGTGASSASPGLSMPEKKWPEDGIDYHGIKFAMGPKDANNALYGTSAGAIVAVNASDSYSKVYIAGFAVGASAVSGDFTVTYSDNSTTAKTIKFNGWRSDLSGWNRLAWIDDKPYVLDSIAHANNHYHSSTGTNNSTDVMEVDNYIFAYDIDADSSKTIKSITIPANANIKITAITLAKPVDGYGKVYDSSKEDEWSLSAPTPAVVQNVIAEYDSGSDPQYSNFIITWNQAENAVKYRLHYGTTADFTPAAANLLTETGSLTYTHVSPSITGAQALAGTTKLYYKVIAVGKANNASTASAASNALAPRLIDYALGLTAASRVIANGRTGTGESWEMALNGNLSNKWCTTFGGASGSISASNPAWLAVDLTGIADSTVKIERFEVYHCGAGGEQASANTRDFSILYSTDSTNAMTQTATNPNGTWVTAATATANQTSVTVYDMSTPIDARFVRLRITAPEYTAWSGAARIYGFKAIGTNPDFVPPAPTSIAQNVEITQIPILGDKQRFDQVKLAVDYDFYNVANDSAPGTITEGNTVVKWYKKLQDNYSTYYVSVPEKASGDIIQTTDDLKLAKAYRCEITVYNSDGTKGSAVNADFDVKAPVDYVASLYENDTKLALSDALGKTVDVAASFTASPLQAGSVYVCAAAYDSKGVMLAMKQAPADISETGVFSCTVPAFEVSKNTVKMKVFFWGKDTFVPISEEALVN